jgi:hypothetical protein
MLKVECSEKADFEDFGANSRKLLKISPLESCLWPKTSKINASGSNLKAFGSRLIATGSKLKVSGLELNASGLPISALALPPSAPGSRLKEPTSRNTPPPAVVRQLNLPIEVPLPIPSSETMEI